MTRMQRKCQELPEMTEMSGWPWPPAAPRGAPGPPKPEPRSGAAGGGPVPGRAHRPRRGPAVLLAVVPHRQGPPLGRFGASFASRQASASPAGFSFYRGQASHTLSYTNVMKALLFLFLLTGRFCLHPLRAMDDGNKRVLKNKQEKKKKEKKKKKQTKTPKERKKTQNKYIQPGWDEDYSLQRWLRPHAGAAVPRGAGAACPACPRMPRQAYRESLRKAQPAAAAAGRRRASRLASSLPPGPWRQGSSRGQPARFLGSGRGRARRAVHGARPPRSSPTCHQHRKGMAPVLSGERWQ
ncbi:uncharacterized protein LOC130147079 [Falco biarmicus]|uniref:uncharacterized protein LOC130147079 n=1 Tax=Falco biarmicus TaxID=345155 RepID=UPI0024BC1A61|nr:uncharacterized protein LOC130147079 [Falco biarmicus]